MTAAAQAYDNVTVLSANTPEELAELEAQLAEQYAGVRIAPMLQPVAKHVRVYRLVPL